MGWFQNQIEERRQSDNLKLEESLLDAAGVIMGRRSVQKVNDERFVTKSAIDEILKSIDLNTQANKYPNELSGGQQQRVSIARSIAKNPNILFGDEPTGAIDEQMSKNILNLFVDINRKYKTTIIIVTHNPILADLATMVINISNGTIKDIKYNSNPKTVAQLNWANK